MLGSIGSQLGVYQLGSIPLLVGVVSEPETPDVLELIGTFSGSLALAGSESLLVTGAGSFSGPLSGSGSEGTAVTGAGSQSGALPQIGTVD